LPWRHVDDARQSPSSPGSPRSSRLRRRLHQRDLDENLREEWQSRPWSGDDLMADTNSHENDYATDRQKTTSTTDARVTGNVCARIRRDFVRVGHIFVSLFLRMTDYWLGPSSSNRHCRQVFRSVRAISVEQKRQREQNRWIIHPFSRFRCVVQFC